MDQLKFYQMGLSPEIQSNIEIAIGEVIKSGQFIGGNVVTQFENDFAKLTGAKHVVSCGNGLDAIELAIRTLNLPPNSKIAVSAHTFFATWLAILNCGHIPVGVDAESLTYQMDPKQLQAILLENPDIQAVIYVHMHGLVGPIEAINNICKNAGIPLIEDCAQAHGLKIGSVHAGTFGTLGTFSFYPTKNLPAFGDAGCIIASNNEIAKARALSNYGWNLPDRSHHELLGRNSRMDTLQAAILTVMLNELSSLNEARREIAKNYYDRISHLSKVILPEYNENSVWHHFPIQVSNRKQLCNFLDNKGIPYQINYPIPCFRQKAYLESGVKIIGSAFPESEKISKNAICLPLNPWLDSEILDLIVNTLYEWEEIDQ